MSAARGRHAPPPEVRLPLQRDRLLRAAALEFAQRGYAGSSSESISRRAAMSKATFYEHFSNKEQCMLALYEHATRVVQAAMATAAANAPTGDADERMKAGTRAFLTALAENPEFAQTLLVEIIGAGPLAVQRRDQILQTFAAVLDAENAAAARRGLIGRFASPYDTLAVVGAIGELVSRQVRLGQPEDILDLAPVIDRLILGLLPPARS
jgi:AcrR family transcriptional regulator